MNEFCNELSNHKDITNLVAANEGAVLGMAVI